MEKQEHKSHQKPSAGAKFKKKKEKKEKKKGIEKQKGNNPKAFIASSRLNQKKRVQRKADLEQKKFHVPMIDRSAIDPPPIFIAVVGPPKVFLKKLIINELINQIIIILIIFK